MTSPLHLAKQMVAPYGELLFFTTFGSPLYGTILNTEAPVIGLDFDDTVTTNPYMWAELVNIFNRHGSLVYVVTYRNKHQESKDIDAFLTTCKIEKVVFTDCKAKRPFCTANNIHIDIWIDDNPLAVVASLTSQRYTFETKD